MQPAEHPSHGSSKLRAVALGVLLTVLVVGLILIVLLAGWLLFGSAPAGAETPSEVASEASGDGVYVSFSRHDVDAARLADAVADADRLGLDLIVVVPLDPQPSASAFARRVQELTEVDAALVFPRGGPLEAHVVEDLSASRPRALDSARALVDPAQAVGAFSQELIDDSSRGSPVIVGQTLRALVLFSVVVGAVVLIEYMVDQVRPEGEISRP